MSPLDGINYFLKGAQRAFDADVRPFVILPAIASFIIIVGGLWWTFDYIQDFAAYLQSALPEWLSFLNVALEPLLYLLGVLLGAWMFGFLATIIGSPFLGELAQRVSREQVNDIPWWKQLLPTLVREGRKLIYQLPRLLVLVVISLIPLVNAVAPFLWLTYGAWMMAVQFGDYLSENRGDSFVDTLSLLRQNRLSAMGLGACITLGMGIPFVNVMIAPIAVVGATLYMQDLRAKESQRQDLAKKD